MLTLAAGCERADSMARSISVRVTTTVNGQSCTRPILAVRFANSPINTRSSSNLHPKPLLQIQHRLRSTRLSRRYDHLILLHPQRQLPTTLQIQLRRVLHTFHQSICRVSHRNITCSIVTQAQEVWHKQQVRPCLCQMGTIIIITMLQI